MRKVIAFLSTFAIMAMITLFSVALVTQAACTPAPTAGDDTIVCTGTSGNVNGGDGSDSITNNGVMGNMRGGSGNDSLVNSDGATADNLYGNAGNDNILNSGTVTDGIEGGGGDDTITNGGSTVYIDGGNGDDTITNGGSTVYIDGGNGDDTITNDGDAVYVDGGGDDDTITNNGTASCIYGGDGDDIITNNGTVNCVIDGDDGDDIITNNGQVADHVLGGGDNDTMTNGLTGVIEGAFRGNGGDDTLINYGTVKRNMNGNNGNDVVINYGIVERNLRGGDGSDVIQQMLGSVVLENIEGGDGDDNVYLYGGLVGGVIDGGANNDTLHFLQVVADCQEYEALNASFSTWNPATGAVTINAFFYSWLNFETLINGLVGQNCEVSSITVTVIPNDGRLNYNDLVHAPIAVYCHVGGGINVIGLTGESSFLVEKNAIARAQASALSSKKPVILQAKGGNTLLVGDDGLLIATSPNPNNATDIYTFVFDWQMSCEEELKAS